ncbi:diaminopropionate ammonia-lyase [Massilia sp. MB5]|uniref:diaminopropionate ammonia-lyase n=1 Tax=Massilia sp. MB5 TaxID=2919578 RepID=UPI001F10D267|nr:diaminopropionate ammonia-lyase [Massilia sp. MB5]UMR29362.1 diaminopropionate ammonia-lyase [Massilia sp. MB5]
MFVLNRRDTLAAGDAALFGDKELALVRARLACLPDFAPTPLHALPGLARTAGVGAIHIKDERRRMKLGSFKALGGMYATLSLLLEAAGKALACEPGWHELCHPALRAALALQTVCCATDGNHGRAVAAAARLAGAQAHIFVHAGVSRQRLLAIRQYGAKVSIVRGTYDDAVAEARRASAERGWHLVSDTAWPGYERIPARIMQGYAVLLDEALAEMAQPPSHVFVQAGVGGLAGALAARLALRFGREQPRLIVVEAQRAACLYASCLAREPVSVDPGQPTVMAMLECYQPSLLAWRILAATAHAFMTVDEETARAAVLCLERTASGDPRIPSSESGAAGLAGLLHAAAEPAMRSAFGLDRDSRVLLIASEGASEPIGQFREPM